MFKIYADAAFDRTSGLGAYCVVITGNRVRPDWYVRETDGAISSYKPELDGLNDALKVGRDLYEKYGEPVKIFCDNIAAVRSITPPQGITVHHFKGHQLGSADVIIDDDVKRHHWADIMARQFLKSRLDALSTSAYNSKHKGDQ